MPPPPRELYGCVVEAALPPHRATSCYSPPHLKPSRVGCLPQEAVHDMVLLVREKPARKKAFLTLFLSQWLLNSSLRAPRGSEK